MTVSPPRGFGGVFRADETARSVYAEAAGIGRIVPVAVAVPRDVEDVQTLVRWARSEGHALVPRGSGSSMAGGAIGPGVVVDLSRLRGLGDADRDARCIRAEVGALRGEVQRRAAGAGLRFPVDPSSGEFCTIGGMVGTNAAGAHSLLHGPTRRWVLGIDCVFDDGSVATIRRNAAVPDVAATRRFMTEAEPAVLAADIHPRRVLKNSSGYAVASYQRSRDLVDLLVGSEGTLALFTAVELALAPAAAASASLLLSFVDLDSAVAAAIVSREQGAAACELLDKTFLAIAARGGTPLPVNADAQAVLMIEIEAETSDAARAQAEKLSVLLRANGAEVSIMAVDKAREMELWAFRHAASPALSRLDPALRSMQFIEDSAVPPEHLATYVRGVRDILAAHDTVGVIFGHAGDAHVHVNPLVDVSRPDWRARVGGILDATTDLVARLGGTLSGEHGDGRLRAPLLDRVRQESEMVLDRAVKNTFDPAGVFNPGAKVAEPGQTAIDAVKYDPQLPPLPVAAQRALETIERERAYSRFRLDLL